LNANLLRRWVVEAEEWRASKRTPPRSDSEGKAKLDLCGFVPAKIESPDPINRVIRIELRRGPTVVKWRPQWGGRSGARRNVLSGARRNK